MYSQAAKILHWLVAAAIVLQFILANLAEAAEDNDQVMQQLALLANHKSVGITILTLAVIRLLWRFTHSPPPLPGTMPHWQVIASHISHWTLYTLLFLIPISGWLMSSASAYSVSWFNIVQLPDFIAPDPELKELLEEVHETLAGLLFLVASLHIAAAIKHAVFDRDGVLARMSSIVSISLFIGVIVAGIYMLLPTSGATTNATTENVLSDTSSPEAADDMAEGNLPSWDIDYDLSSISFTGEQAGAKFTGTWTQWQADIRFDRSNLASSTARVTISTGLPDTGDAERDTTMQNADWFDTANHPTVIFTATDFTVEAEGYAAQGILTVKERRTPIQFTFTIERDNDRVQLLGKARIDRLKHNIGIGEWLDTSWVGQFVDVTVRVAARAPETTGND